MPRPLSTLSAKPPVPKRKRRRSSPLSRVHAAARESDAVIRSRHYTADDHMDDPTVPSQLSRSSSLDAHMVPTTETTNSRNTSFKNNSNISSSGTNNNVNSNDVNNNNSSDNNNSSTTATSTTSSYHHAAHTGASVSLATTNATTAATMHDRLSEYDRNDNDANNDDGNAEGNEAHSNSIHGSSNNNNSDDEDDRSDTELERDCEGVRGVRHGRIRSNSSSRMEDGNDRRTVEMTFLTEGRSDKDLAGGGAAGDRDYARVCVRSSDSGNLFDNEIGTSRIRRNCNHSHMNNNASSSANHCRREYLEEMMRRRLHTVTPAIKDVVDEVQQKVQASAEAEQRVSDLLRGRAAARERVAEIALSRDPAAHAVDVARLNVGGEMFVVSLRTLLSREPGSYFHILFNTCLSAKVPVFTDASGAIFIDRDPTVFRYILNYLRGYKHFQMLDEELLRKLKVDARYFQLNGLLEIMNATEPGSELQFLPGPGVNPERNRLRVVYGVATVGEVLLVTGRHRIMFEIIKADYVGVGLVSDACVNTDQEFHKTSNCCIYYMSGVFYSNFPHHRKEENLERIESGHFVSILVDMDKGFVEFTLKNSTKLLSIGRARRLRFAVTMKLSSSVRIVPEEEAATLVSPRPTATLAVSPDSHAFLGSIEAAS